MRLAAVFALAFGCSKMAVEGNVVDGGNRPIVGAMVTAVGSSCYATTDDAGHFVLPCQPGSYTLSLGKQDHISSEVAIEATERKRYQIGTHVLIEMPKTEGLFLFDGSAYQSMAPGALSKRTGTQGGKSYRQYCLNRKASEANELRAGDVQLFNHKARGWRPFRLNDSGCAYKDTKSGHSNWKVAYKDKAKTTDVRISEDMKLSIVNLEPGDYFLAHWDKGFFTQSESDKKAYTGFWLKVSP